MDVTINGESASFNEERSLADIFKTLGKETSTGIAIALNGEVVPKERWGKQNIKNGDQILIITAAQGG